MINLTLVTDNFIHGVVCFCFVSTEIADYFDTETYEHDNCDPHNNLRFKFTVAKIKAACANQWHRLQNSYENMLFLQIYLVFPLLAEPAFDPDVDLFG